MFKRLGRFAVLAVCLFAIAIVMGGCNGDDPPIVEDDLLEFVSVDPPDGSTIQPDATVTVTFNRAIEPDDGVYSFMGRDPDGDSTETGDRVITGSTMTITRSGAHPFDAGYLKVEIQWYAGRVTLNYTVEGSPPPSPKEKTFKEQLEGTWSITKGALSDGSIVPAVTDEFGQAGWFVIPSLFFYNSLRFDSSGGVVLIYYFQYVNAIPRVGVNLPKLELTYTLKGSYAIADDSGTSATMTLSFADLALDVKPGNGNWVLPKDLINGGPLADFLGDVLNKERVRDKRG